jgi:hypothetical protein
MEADKVRSDAARIRGELPVPQLRRRGAALLREARVRALLPLLPFRSVVIVELPRTRRRSGGWSRRSRKIYIDLCSDASEEATDAPPPRHTGAKFW